MTTPKESVPWREKISYGCGDFASVLYWQTFMAYLLLFYTDVFGLPAAAAGTMFLLSRVWDGVNDPMMGVIADRTKTRWGRFRPYLLWGCVPFAVVGVLTFTTPDLGPTGKLVWAYVTFVSLMMLYTFVNIPYTALLGVITADPRERTGISSIKFLGAFSAGAVVSATLLPMVAALGGGNDARGWQLAFVVYGIVAVALFLVCFAGTRERVSPPPEQRTSIRQDVRDLFANRPWVVLLATTFTYILFVAVRISATAHYFKYFVGAQEVRLPFADAGRTFSFEAIVSAYHASGQVLSVVGILGASWFARRLGKKRAFLAMLVVSIATTLAFYVLEPHQVGWMFLLHGAGSLVGGPMVALLWAMYADAADYSEWRTGRRATGLVFSASTMSQKISWAFGSACAGWLLAAVGFEANVAQTPDVLRGLVLLVSVIPAAFGFVAMAAMSFYPLGESRLDTIETELRARRAATT